MKDWKKETSLWYYSNYQPDYLYVTLLDDWCGQTVDLDFEGVKLMAPKGWHEVLTWVYGDYMELLRKKSGCRPTRIWRSRSGREAASGITGKDEENQDGQEDIRRSVSLQ